MPEGLLAHQLRTVRVRRAGRRVRERFESKEESPVCLEEKPRRASRRRRRATLREEPAWSCPGAFAPTASMLQATRDLLPLQISAFLFSLRWRAPLPNSSLLP